MTKEKTTDDKRFDRVNAQIKALFKVADEEGLVIEVHGAPLKPSKMNLRNNGKLLTDKK